MTLPRPPMLLSLAVLMVTALGACTPTIYKEDIATFSRSVDATTGAFNGLLATSSAQYRDLALDELARSKTRLGIDRDCTQIYETGTLVEDSQCLTAWARYRATASEKRGDPPVCEGASETVAAGQHAFYDMELLGKREADLCRIGVRNGDGELVSAPLEDAEMLLVNAPRLLPALQNYAKGLAAIADAKDRDELVSSVGQAKDAMVRLAERIDSMDGEASPYTATIGPIADLFGAALIAGLEQRRFSALQRLTRQADPVINETAMIFSNISMPMVLVQLQNAGTDFTFSLTADGSEVEGTEWRESYDLTRSAREKYLAVFETSPTPVFRSMATAHHELTLSLQYPSRQYDLLKAAVESFAGKAEAAHLAIETARAKAEEQKKAEEEKKKAEATSGT